MLFCFFCRPPWRARQPPRRAKAPTANPWPSGGQVGRGPRRPERRPLAALDRGRAGRNSEKSGRRGGLRAGRRRTLPDMRTALEGREAGTGAITGWKHRMNPRGNPENLGAPWREGHSGNPKGRPKKAPFAKALDRIARMAVKDIGVKPTDKVPFAIVKRWAQEALRGDLRAAIEMANRVEGPPVQTLQHQGLEGFYQAEPGQREILARI